MGIYMRVRYGIFNMKSKGGIFGLSPNFIMVRGEQQHVLTTFQQFCLPSVWPAVYMQIRHSLPHDPGSLFSISKHQFHAIHSRTGSQSAQSHSAHEVINHA
ncbi:hypothetical protein PABG_02820 [Paracoccidioides brasiliensis Pb03]|nr:hypothetical protein PABG_02820 [Paracoccidioides brasiliensis Pb03]